MTIYLVTGPYRYREHEPGDTFEATLPPDVERRAISHGAIEVISDHPVSLQPGSWKLSRGWHNQPKEE